MAQVTTYECDVCHVQKKETNHWWVVYSGGNNTIHVAAFGHIATTGVVQHTCGIQCTLKLVQAKMQEVLNLSDATVRAS